MILNLFSTRSAGNSYCETTHVSGTGIRRFSFIAGVLLIVILIARSALAQQYFISTIAGGAPPVTPAAAVGVSIGKPSGVATDSAGNLYFTSLNCVFKVATSGRLTLVAGNSRAGYSGDGGPAIAAQLNSPWGVAFDRADNLYIADTGNSRIRRVSPAGLITSVAGNGTQGFSGDGGPAAAAQLNLPEGVAVDAGGNIYIADTGNSLVRQVAPTGIIVTFAGKGGPGYYGDGGPATLAQVSNPEGLAVDASGDLFIADTVNDAIRMVSPGGTISTVAGNGSNNLGSPSVAGCRPSRIASTMSGASSVNRRMLPTKPRSIFSATAISLIEAYRPPSSIRFHRNARAKAFTIAGSARVRIAAVSAGVLNVTTVLRPGR